MNTYKDSYGNSWTTPQIERKIKRAATELIDMQLLEHGYNFCEKCRRNDCKPIDAAHYPISRKEAKEKGMVEVLWDYRNINLWGRDCHKEADKLNLKFHE